MHQLLKLFLLFLNSSVIFLFFLTGLRILGDSCILTNGKITWDPIDACQKAYLHPFLILETTHVISASVSSNGGGVFFINVTFALNDSSSSCNHVFIQEGTLKEAKSKALLFPTNEWLFINVKNSACSPNGGSSPIMVLLMSILFVWGLGLWFESLHIQVKSLLSSAAESWCYPCDAESGFGFVLVLIVGVLIAGPTTLPRCAEYKNKSTCTLPGKQPSPIMLGHWKGVVNGRNQWKLIGGSERIDLVSIDGTCLETAESALSSSASTSPKNRTQLLIDPSNRIDCEQIPQKWFSYKKFATIELIGLGLMFAWACALVVALQRGYFSPILENPSEELKC